MQVHLSSQDVSDAIMLRRKAGKWLEDRRKACGLSQRELADAVGAGYYTFVSQIEAGCGRIPQDKYRSWASALGLEPREFVLALLPYYDPITYEIVFPSDSCR